MRRLVEHAHHIVEAERLLLDDRGDHHPRRRAADRAGQLRLDELHQPGIGRYLLDRGDAALARIVAEHLGRARRTEKAARQRQQLFDTGAPAPEHRAGDDAPAAPGV
ncbi:MAG: hypothetical protein ABIO45_12870, partial [Burkholderiaceae bacterium]